MMSTISRKFAQLPGPRENFGIMDWPHAPLHRFGVGEAVFFVTGSTYLDDFDVVPP
jgi:hypothetical protein